MEAHDDRHPVLFLETPESVDEQEQAIRLIHVFGPVQGHEEIFSRIKAEIPERLAGTYLRCVMVEHLLYGVAGHEDPFAGNSLPQQIGSAPFRVRQENVARMIDDPAVDLFRHTVVVAAVSRLHVEHGDPHPLGHHRGEAAVRIAEDQQAVRFLLRHQALASGQDRSHLRHRGVRPAIQNTIRWTDFHLLEEDVVEGPFIVLAGMGEHVFAETVESRDHAAQADDLGTGPEDREDLHGRTLIQKPVGSDWG